MKRENIGRAVKLSKLHERLEMCRDLLLGGCSPCVESASGEVYYIHDEIIRLDTIASINKRIDDINKELEEL